MMTAAVQRAAGRNQALEKTNATENSSSLNVKGVVATPEVVYKLSKKIAQLTKVIYYLNTKSEDHVIEVQSLVEAYEDEIQRVLSDARNKVQFLKSRVEEGGLQIRAKEEVIQSYVAKMSAMEIDAEAADSRLQELEALVVHAERERSDLILDYEKQIVDIRATVAKYEKQQEQFVALQLKYDAVLKSQADGLDAQVQEVRRRTQMEVGDGISMDAALAWLSLFMSKMEEMRNDYVKRMKAVTEERQRIEDNMKDAVTAVEERYRDEIKAHQREILNLRNKLQDHVAESTSTYKELETKLTGDLRKEHEALLESESRVQALSTTINSKNERIQELEGDVYRTVSHLQEHRNKLDTCTMKIEVLQGELTSSAAKFECACRRIEDLDMQLAAKDQAFIEQEGQLRSLLEEKQSVESKLRASTESHQASIKAIGELQRTVDIISKQKTEVEHTAQEQGRFQAAMNDTLQHHIVTLKEEHQKNLAAALRTLRIELQEEFSLQADARVREAKRESEAALSELTEAHLRCTTEFDAFRHASRAEMEAYRAQSELQAKELQLTLEETSKEKASLSLLVKDITLELEAKSMDISKLKIDIQNFKDTINALEVDKADLFQKMVHIEEQTRSDMSSKFEKEKRDVADNCHMQALREMEKLRDSLEQKAVQQLQSMATEKDKQYDEQLQRMRTHYEAKLLEVNEQASAAEAHCQKKSVENLLLAKQMQDLRRIHEDQLAELSAAKESALQEGHRRGMAEATLREEQMKKDASIALTQLEEKHRAELAALDSLIAGREEEFRKASVEAEVAYQKVCGTSMVRSLTLILSPIVKNAQATLLAEQERLLKEFEKKMEVLKAESARDMENALSRLEGQHSALMATRVAAHKDQMSTATAQIDQLELQCRRLREDIARHADDIAAKDAEVLCLRQDLNHLQAELLTTRENAVRSIEQLKHDLEGDKQQQLSTMQTEHIDEVKQMLRDFEQAQAYLRNRISHLSEKLREADEKYQNREPRRQDLEHIQQLKEQLQGEKQAWAALKEEVDFYKLELNNREANFNKIFNRGPVVVANMANVTKPKLSMKSQPNLRMARLPPLSATSAPL
ncbi:hypothetical protein HDU85_004867 [Gaertneriomyces sp. JEL0708]|nr:hypothetical protein HDU85_004867 [Gaertneriomyces sp. JEL0708]